MGDRSCLSLSPVFLKGSVQNPNLQIPLGEAEALKFMSELVLFLFTVCFLHPQHWHLHCKEEQRGSWSKRGLSRHPVWARGILLWSWHTRVPDCS